MRAFPSILDVTGNKKFMPFLVTFCELWAVWTVHLCTRLAYFLPSGSLPKGLFEVGAAVGVGVGDGVGATVSAN